jgi:O-antigen ligase
MSACVDNPNIYGMLMGAGVLLAVGLLAERRKAKGERLNEEKRKAEGGKRKLLRSLRSFAAKVVSGESPDTARGTRALPIILFVAAGMMGVGLLFSYSRGAWMWTAIGLLYLAKAHGKFKWRFVLPGIFVVTAVVCFFWHSTADNGPWYLKRLDFSRPSAQHRVAAWRGAVQMMRDHPFGVGWNKAIETYEKNYSPPEDGAAAINTNDYLMLGTQLGLPGLLCFVAYVGLCFRRVGRASRLSSEARQREHEKNFAPTLPLRAGETPALLYACRAGALAMLVAFWFDGGLFKLAKAAVFWILLELGANHRPVGPSCCAASRSILDDQQVVPTDKQRLDYEKAHC